MQIRAKRAKLLEAPNSSRITVFPTSNSRLQNETRKCKTRLNHRFPRKRRTLRNKSGVAKLHHAARSDSVSRLAKS
jgi:hypothetical protein